MKLRVETCDVPGGQRGAIVEYEGEGALELAKLVLGALVLAPEQSGNLRCQVARNAVKTVASALLPALKVLDWGPRAKTGAVEAIRELWGETPERAKKWVAVAPMVVSVPPGFSRASVLERLRTAGVEVE